MKSSPSVKRKLNSVRRAGGFSLIELMIVIATLTSVAAMGYIGLTNTNSAVKDAKLRQDVAVLNRAVNTYLSCFP